ncbi:MULTISPECIES: serine hydrolase domain-containing protein [unclassified Mesorhizobium]|uniref:serine hydrolase domain-containing protein n=1 Tax=unclassified Mesorhizobium TaxID=325217 RepID=UPI001CCC32F4|nr:MULTISPECIES: serine hydrolase domain-containing protein [unclassified Mesorhizobium]MBZ9683904.1 beta-lactamase family protein [Mesorhizobium sp. CO1-1-2]MBZ9725367.1 beta-lactamase family protein [Mesorhizobium sp. CO1-1-11]MBZ9923696.1 beta-lactamase family protein [Mesorhizobium sp. BR1-1-4]
MTSTRRSLLKMGLVGLLVPQARVVLADQKPNQTFETWRRNFETGVPARMAVAKVSGAAVGIISKNGSTSYSAGFGFADIQQQRKFTADTPTHLASVSKLFTASALVQLFERKGLDLHRDVNEFIDFTVINPHHPNIPITPHQLITHTSSISDDGYGDYSVVGDPTQSLADFLRDYLVKGGDTYSPRKSYYKAKPGRKWSYSNVAVALAGYVVECLSKQGFSSYVEKQIFEPLGIRNAHWHLKQFAPDVISTPYRFEKGAFVPLPQEGYPDVPAGMLRCSVSDLAKMLRAMLGGETASQAILSPAAVTAMLRDQIDPAIVHYQGLGWIEEEINGTPFVGHSGSDFGASNMVILTKDHRHAVAVLMNIDGTEKTDTFRSSVIEDLLAGADLAT